MARRVNVWTSSAAACLLLTMTGCGGGGSEPGTAEKSSDIVLEDGQLDSFVTQVKKMKTVEWSGQLLTKSPENGGRQIFELSGRFTGSNNSSEVSMDSRIGGKRQQVDYLVVDGRTFFNSDAWGPNSADCWADITGDPERTWGLPTQLNPTWPVNAARAVRLAGDGVAVAIPAKAVLTGMPRGLFPTVPPGLEAIEAGGEVIPHGPLLEVGVDVLNMWNKVPAEQLASIDTKQAGWWAMTMKESSNTSAVQPPKHIFDPAVTPPSQCTRK